MKRGPDWKFVAEANHKPLLPKSNNQQSKNLMVWGQSIQPQSERERENEKQVLSIVLLQTNKGI